MMLVFLYLLNVVLITRAAWVFYDKPARPSVLAGGFAVQLLALLLLQWEPVVALLAAAMIAVNLLTWLSECRTAEKQTRLGGRLVGLVCWIVLLGFLCSDLLGVSYNFWTIKLGRSGGALSDTLGLLGQTRACP